MILLGQRKQTTLARYRNQLTIRFDFLQDPDDPTKFMLYEAYETADGAAAHKKTEHYLTWRETVAPWMAQPRQGKPYNVLAP